MLSVKATCTACPHLRRLSVPDDAGVEELLQALRTVFGVTNTATTTSLTYTDPDGDEVTVATNAELAEAKRLRTGDTLRVALKVTSPATASPATEMTLSPTALAAAVAAAPRAAGPGAGVGAGPTPTPTPTLAEVKAAVTAAGLDGVVPVGRLAKVFRNQGHDVERTVARVATISRNQARRRAVAADTVTGKEAEDVSSTAVVPPPTARVADVKAAVEAAGLDGVVGMGRLVKVFRNQGHDVNRTVARVAAIARNKARRRRDGGGGGGATSGGDTGDSSDGGSEQFEEVRAAVEAAGLSDVVPARRLRCMARNNKFRGAAVVARLRQVASKATERQRKQSMRKRHMVERAIEKERTVRSRRGDAIAATESVTVLEHVAALCQTYATQLQALDAAGLATYKPRLHLVRLLDEAHGDVSTVMSKLSVV